AQARKAPVQRLADIVAGRFVSAVILLAAFTFAFWQWVPGTAHQPAILIAITVLIIACPCGLGLATPVTVLAGSAAAARKGVLIKGGDVLEEASQVTDVVLDKTGTLTTGGLKITACDDLGTMPRAIWLPLAAAVERRAVHPIAMALHREALATVPADLLLCSAGEVSTHPGLGVVGWVDGRRVVVGNATLMEQEGLPVPASHSWDPGAETVVYVAVDGAVVGRLCMTDPLREDARETVNSLRAMGITVHVFSGDRPEAVAAVARLASITDARGGMLPHDKLAAIRELQEGGCTVAMVGDGINDAPAMAQADVAMAVSTGSDLSIESAHIILLRARLMGAAEALSISRRTFRVIQENLALSIGYNMLAVPLAMVGMVVPLAAAIAMSLRSLLVVGNALKLRWRDDGAAQAPLGFSAGAEGMRCC
ncbi:MAG TPA: cation-translocating P-type ATPase, partial [bacterium]